jgi:regulatory protein
MSYKVTALKVQKRNPKRVNVYLDGEFAFGLSRIVAAWLQVGQELKDDEIAVLQEKETREAALQQALKYLEYRSRSEAEIIRNLKEHKFSPEIIEETIRRLAENGLINDSHFAQTWVENRDEFRPRSRRALAYELRLRGISDEDISTAVEAVDEEQSAYRAAQQKANKLSDDDWQQFRQKLTAFLARRGFSYSTASQVVQQIWEEKQADSGSED